MYKLSATIDVYDILADRLKEEVPDIQEDELNDLIQCILENVITKKEEYTSDIVTKEQFNSCVSIVYTVLSNLFADLQKAQNIEFAKISTDVYLLTITLGNANAPEQ